MERAIPRTTFLLPPQVHNERGEVRKAGFEFEYAGLDLNQSAALIQQVFGGRHVVESTFVHRVVGTRYGEFGVEMDSSLLKDKRYEKPLRGLGVDLDGMDTEPMEKFIAGVASTLVPFEIGAPPIPITELAALDELRRLLHDHRAEGTRASLLYAFGLHINPEAPRIDAPTLLNYLRAFLLLYPWLEDRIQVDIARRVTPYVNAFPAAYARLILADDYPASPGQLIDDYLEHNPTRNRPLDMLPVLACLDKERVMARAADTHLVKPRPAFHYRMPNCLIDEPDWTLAREWNTWIGVERLAANPTRMAKMARDYLTADDKWYKPFYDDWPDLLESHWDARTACPTPSQSRESA